MASRTLVLGSLIGLLVLAAGTTLSTPEQLTIAPGGCSGFEFENLNPKFSYEASFTSNSVASCADKIRLSKLYVQGACARNRNNQISLDSVKDLTCTEANSNDQASCTDVFNEGPADAKITISNLTAGQTFDTGNVCANQSKGYVYIQSTCTTSTDVAINFSQSTYKGPICLNIGGHHLSGWAIAIIVVGIFAVLLVAFWMLWCCCCGSCCCLC